MPTVQPEVYRRLWSLVHQLPADPDEPIVIYPARWLAAAWAGPVGPDPRARAASTRALWMLLTDWLELTQPHAPVLLRLDLGYGGESHELHRFRDALGHLRRSQPRAAEVALFRAFGRMHHAEIATATDVSEPVVSARWEVARIPLRRAMGGEGSVAAVALSG